MASEKVHWIAKRPEAIASSYPIKLRKLNPNWRWRRFVWTKHRKCKKGKGVWSDLESGGWNERWMEKFEGEVLTVWLGIPWKKKVGSRNWVEENGLHWPSPHFDWETKRAKWKKVSFCCVKYTMKGVQLQNYPLLDYSYSVVSIHGRLRRENQNSKFVFLPLPKIMVFREG